LVGANTISINYGDAYTDLGASANDDIDTDVSVVVSGSVDSNTVGSYTLTYTVTDAAGNETTVTRIVNVVDTTRPTITLNGLSELDHNFGDDYTDLGATATDNVDGTVTVITTGDVSIDQINSYDITYTATDTSDNTSTLIRTVNVLDLAGPVITLTGESTVVLGQGRTYTELGATAEDNVDGGITVDAPTGTFDNTLVGEYTLTYSVTDDAGNTSTVERIISIIASRPFITTWKTDNRGTTGYNEIKIGTGGGLIVPYNYKVDWGDGSTTNETGDAIHTYVVAGTYTVQINGDFPQIFFDGSGYDNDKLLSIEQWGDISWLSMVQAFAECSNLVSNAIDVPDLRLVEGMRGMFAYATSFNGDLSAWDVSSVTNMYYMFEEATSFNSDLSGWDVSSVTNMGGMFAYTEFNGDISAWDVSSVTNMSYMFEEATSFNGDLSAWDVSSVTSMSNMFNGVDLSTTSYDALLIGWSALQLQNSVSFSAGNSQYSSEVVDARAKLINDFNWNIEDDGIAL
jgi:surface protein